jgi:Ankyrin repeats (3 copies)
MTEQSKIAINQPFLPWELIDEILVEVGDTKLAIKMERFYIVKKIDADAEFNWAIDKGHLEYLKYLNERGLCVGEYDEVALWDCAAKGYLNILKYCHEHIISITEYGSVLNSAASGGHLDLVKYLHSIGSKCTYGAMDLAACLGHLDVVKWLHFNRQEGCTKDAMNDAAALGHLEVVKFLYHNRTEGILAEALRFVLNFGTNEQNAVEFLQSEIQKSQKNTS